MEPQTQNASSGIIKGLSIVLIIAIIALIIWKLSDRDEAIAPVTRDENEIATNTPAVVDNRKYKDGTYTATGNYTSPAGPEEVEITLVIENDKVVDATFVGKATHPTSKKVQGLFADGFKSQVVGKSVDEISLTVVNGSSLAPKGFMDALATIKTEAQV